MSNFYLDPNVFTSKGGLSTRRIFSSAECRYLSFEARSIVYGLLDSQSVSPDVTENAVQQAVALGSLNDEEVDAQTFEALFDAVALNSSFNIPVWYVPMGAPYATWIC